MILAHIIGGIDSKILRIEVYNSSIDLGGKRLSIFLINEHTNSISDKSGELGGHLVILLSVSFGPSFQVGIKLYPNSFSISSLERDE